MTAVCTLCCVCSPCCVEWGGCNNFSPFFRRRVSACSIIFIAWPAHAARGAASFVMPNTTSFVTERPGANPLLLRLSRKTGRATEQPGRRDVLAINNKLGAAHRRVPTLPHDFCRTKPDPVQSKKQRRVSGGLWSHQMKKKWRNEHEKREKALMPRCKSEGTQRGRRDRRSRAGGEGERYRLRVRRSRAVVPRPPHLP